MTKNLFSARLFLKHILNTFFLVEQDDSISCPQFCLQGLHIIHSTCNVLDIAVVKPSPNFELKKEIHITVGPQYKKL